MDKKYIATVMKKHYIGEDAYIFSCSHAVIGDIIEENIFVDTNGNEYGPMIHNGMINSSIPYSYFNHIEINDLGKIVDSELPLEEQISEYEYLAKQMFFFVGVTEEDQILCTSFQIPELKDQIAELAKKLDDQEESTKATSIDGATLLNYDKVSDNEITEENYMIEELASKVTNGEFSFAELKTLKKNITQDYESVEGLLDTINLQLEASQAGTSAVALKGEEKCSTSSEIYNENEIDIEDLFEKVTRTLIAQDEAAYRVITEISRKEDFPESKSRGILITGSTGVGKTELMNLIAKYLNKPFKKINSTSLTIPGYSGRDIEEELWDLYASCGYNKEKAEQAIIFFDEIDKKSSSKDEDVSGKGVLNVLLPFIEGSEYNACKDLKKSTENSQVKIDTSNMIVILGGAYNFIYKNQQKTISGLGKDLKQANKNITAEDLIESDAIPDELVGRVTIVKMKDLYAQEFKRLLLESDKSPIKIQEKIFQKYNVKITFTNDYLNTISLEAEKRKTGARGLNTIVDETTLRAYAEIKKKSNRGLYSEVIFDKETVNDNSKYQLVKKL